MLLLLGEYLTKVDLLYNSLSEISPAMGIPNRCVWWFDPNDFFVKSTYSKLFSSFPSKAIWNLFLKLALDCISQANVNLTFKFLGGVSSSTNFRPDMN